MLISKNDATHFLRGEDPETAKSDLLDCIPLQEGAGGKVKVVVFSGRDDFSTVCEVDAVRVLSVEDVTDEIVNRVLNDTIRNMPGNDTNLH